VRIVFDTNVYISAFAAPGSRSSLALQLAARGVFELVVSPAILAELHRKLSGPKFGFSEQELDDADRNIAQIATIVEPEVELSVLDDEPDNRILECAVASGASAIVTGDKELLALGSCEGIGIMTVAGLLYTFPEPET
jgi:putative PIN family toxin of toxin-antitoxin system